MYGPYIIQTTEAVDGTDEYPRATLMYKLQVQSKWLAAGEPGQALGNKAAKNHDYVRIIYLDKITDFLIKVPFGSVPIVWDGNVATEKTKHSFYTEHPEEFTGRCTSGSVSDLYTSVPTGYWGQSWPAGEMSTVASWVSTGSMSIYTGPRLKTCTITG